MTNTAKLIEAFHLLYDVKDAVPAGSDEAVACYEAIAAIKSMLDPSPRRFDGEGRSDGASLVISYEHTPEILGAVEIAAKVTAATGDHVQSGEYLQLLAKYGKA